ncbi:MAG: tRNA preQ1(34) S-adenosylmethionine ribosyltransferase-isomerase QueA [Candidatus Pacebacteria bacterium]|nr:tRNA preQ1(34) S-adenosylmethionine ribosyltransferase-isomerase QueA [Candidatus Paceibacterota bacterium]
MEKFKRLLEEYDYKISPEIIAQKPASPRDSAKLLVYKKKEDKVFYDTFVNLAKYLPADAVLVFNQTKVLPARLMVKKETGGKAEILYVEMAEGNMKVLADRFLPVASKVYLTPKLHFLVMSHRGKYYLLKPCFPVKNIFEILEKYGSTPIPPYIKHSPLSEKQLKKEYQAIFAKIRGSIAAPTASLHFTDRLLKKIKKFGAAVKFVTLHVGLGTFSPLTEENIKTGKLHSEYYEIDKKTADFLKKAKKQGRPIIAVGTTVVRTLESVFSAGGMKKLSGPTDLFIKSGYKFNFVNGVITNFHVPKSSLLMLASAFVGKKKLFEIYKKAMAKKFRFFSFGDGMLIY